MPAVPDAAVERDRVAPLLAVLDSIEPLLTMSRDELVVIALGSAAARPRRDYLTLADEHNGAFEFRELGMGSVPTVEAVVGVKPLLVLAGETIVGGKQNRIISITVWLPPQRTTPIPVTCLEAGRWDSGRHFRAGRAASADVAIASRSVGTLSPEAARRSLCRPNRIATTSTRYHPRSGSFPRRGARAYVGVVVRPAITGRVAHHARAVGPHHQCENGNHA